jgi:hypothetical protein
MKHVSSIRAGWFFAGLSLASLTSTGCLKDLGLSDSATEEGATSTGVGGAPGGVGHIGVSSTSGVGGGGHIGVSSTSGVGGGGHIGVGGGSEGVSSSSSGVGGSEGVSSSSGGVDGGGSGPLCQLGVEPVSCDFAHLNADCAPYGAVCDFLFNQCSCCFLHDELTCSTDADCEASFGASSFCSAGTCGCK